MVCREGLTERRFDVSQVWREGAPPTDRHTDGTRMVLEVALAIGLCRRVSTATYPSSCHFCNTRSGSARRTDTSSGIGVRSLSVMSK